MINGKVIPQQFTNGTSGELTWLKDEPSEWGDKKYYYPIPQSAIFKNP